MSMDTWAGVAQAILDGFNRHYSLFRQYSCEGKECFERADWRRAAQVNRERIQGYEQRVRETVDIIQDASDLEEFGATPPLEEQN